MALLNKLFLLLTVMGLVTYAVLGLHGLLVAPALAQGSPGAAPATGGAAAPPAANPGMRGGPPLPNVDEALKAARSPDLTTKQQGMANLGTVYAATTDEATLSKLEGVLREAAAHAETAGIRQAAVSALGNKPARNGAALLQATYDRDPEVQTAALNALASAPASHETDARLQQLTASTDPAVATAAVGALMRRYGSLGAEGVPLLVSALGISRGDANSNAALQLLGLRRTGVPTLMTALASSPNATERHGAAVVLALVCAGKSPRQEAFAEAAQAEWKLKQEIPDPDLRPLPVLADRLLHDSDELVREACAEGLGYLGSERAAPALAQALLSDPVYQVRACAASALVLIPGTQALPALQKAVESDKAARVRRFAAEALGWTGDPQAVGALMAATQDPDEQVRRLAALQLGRLKAVQALPALTAMFSDPSEDVRWAAVRAVDGLRSHQAVPALVMAAQDPSVLVAHAAQTALQKLGEVRRGDAHLRQPTQPGKYIDGVTPTSPPGA
jgi:HEAT repeat protein